MDLFLSISIEIKEEVFLKGNVLLNQILRDSARGTKDLDMSVISEELYDTVIVPKLKEFGDNLISNGLAVIYVIKDISRKTSGGIDIKNGNNETVYSVDISLSDINPLGVVYYSFGGNEFLGSSINKILADKCLSTLSVKRFRRIKDFYDIYIIVKSSLNYDSESIFKLMVDKVGLDEVRQLISNQPFSKDVIIKAIHAWFKLSLLRDSDNREIEKPDFIEVLNACYSMYRGIEQYLD